MSDRITTIPMKVFTTPLRFDSLEECRRPAMSDRITMRCLRQGCPRIKKVERAKYIPDKVEEIHSYCPWHEKSGWKAYPELFFDRKGRRLDPETWKLM